MMNETTVTIADDLTDQEVYEQEMFMRECIAAWNEWERLANEAAEAHLTAQDIYDLYKETEAQYGARPGRAF